MLYPHIDLTVVSYHFGIKRLDSVQRGNGRSPLNDRVADEVRASMDIPILVYQTR